MDASFKVFEELPHLFNQIPGLTEAMLSKKESVVENPVYGMLLTTKMVKVCSAASLLKDEMEGYVELIKQICKEEGIEIPKYDPEAPREWTAIFRP